jgi:hypothetical protein
MENLNTEISIIIFALRCVKNHKLWWKTKGRELSKKGSELDLGSSFHKVGTWHTMVDG